MSEILKTIDANIKHDLEQKKYIKEMEAHISYLREENERLKGEIRGLKFAIRCNGVSGGEVSPAE